MGVEGPLNPVSKIHGVHGPVEFHCRAKATLPADFRGPPKSPEARVVKVVSVVIKGAVCNMIDVGHRSWKGSGGNRSASRSHRRRRRRRCRRRRRRLLLQLVLGNSTRYIFRNIEDAPFVRACNIVYLPISPPMEDNLNCGSCIFRIDKRSPRPAVAVQWQGAILQCQHRKLGHNLFRILAGSVDVVGARDQRRQPIRLYIGKHQHLCPCLRGCIWVGRLEYGRLVGSSAGVRFDAVAAITRGCRGLRRRKSMGHMRERG